MINIKDKEMEHLPTLNRNGMYIQIGNFQSSFMY